jgi:hypothetical protein
MTLVFALSAVERLARPAEAIDDASRWSRHVGVVADDRSELVATIERADADPDFVSGDAETAGSLLAIRQQFSTDRHVFVSADETERPTARALGWEYLPVQEAAAKAEWPLVDEASG